MYVLLHNDNSYLSLSINKPFLVLGAAFLGVLTGDFFAAVPLPVPLPVFLCFAGTVETADEDLRFISEKKQTG